MSDDIVERLRQQARVEAKKHGDAVDLQLEWKAAHEISLLRIEVLEQARLLGMSGEREAKLLGEIERLRAENDHLRQARNDALAGGDVLKAEIARYRAGLKIIVDADGFWDAPSLARDLLAGKAAP